ncbi:uspA domain protein [Halosimplex carlsbadense 2-9-1]|uniref:UspA domain protein n=1 Tax=Halosimplex carlsbadense 2-9-1 TaxID=797114 RepID=M0D0F7_9EURY|nr:universal stress protein [Halosimplex carlsbadense]ELZ28157.1 uspA domain protein [Halosimplex carlsbadense 2-9-1]
MFDRVLVPVDGSPESRRAVGYALVLADAFDATVDALAVLDSSEVPDVFDEGPTGQRVESAVRADALDALDAVRRRAAAAGIPATESVVVGHPTEAVLDAVEASGAGLVVLAAHARGRLARFLHRSLAEAVARYAPVPVLTVAGPPTAPPPAFDRILLAVDGSESGRQARSWAFGLARAFDATVSGLYVVETRLGSSGVLRDLLERRGEAVAREIRVQGARTGVEVDTATREGDPAREITAFAADHGVDLVVLGTHGRMGLDRLVMGSVASSVVRGADRPVLTVRPTPRE